MSAELNQLTAYGNDLLSAFREQVDNLPVTKFGPVNASGRLKRETRVEVSEIPNGYRLEMIAPSYVLTLIFGRKPGKFPPLVNIQQWIEDKNIVPRPDADGKTISTKEGKNGYSPLAYLIGRKIANQGNEVHVQGPPSALFADLLNVANVGAELKSRIIPLLVRQVATSLQESVV